MPGLCHGSELLVGNTYIVLASETGERLGVSSQEINNTKDNVAEVAKACELRPVYPKGMFLPTPVDIQCLECGWTVPTVTVNAHALIFKASMQPLIWTINSASTHRP